MKSSASTLLMVEFFREVAAASISPIFETPEKFTALCKDEQLRPYQFTIIVDITGRSPENVRLRQ